MYFDTSILRSRSAILFQRLFPKLGSQAHFNTMCFSFAAKIAACFFKGCPKSRIMCTVHGNILVVVHKYLLKARRFIVI